MFNFIESSTLASSSIELERGVALENVKLHKPKIENRYQGENCVASTA